MHCSNNAVIMQTEQLGRIEALEEELCSSRGKVADLEQKMMEQDWVIAQLVGDNLDHLQDNMRLTTHINSSTERMAQMEHRLGQVGSVVMGFLEGRMEGLLEEEATSESSGNRGSDASGDNQDDQVLDGIGQVIGALAEVMRGDSPMPPTSGLIASSSPYWSCKQLMRKSHKCATEFLIGLCNPTVSCNSYEKLCNDGYQNGGPTS